MFLAHGAVAYILNEKIQEKEIQKLSKGEHLWIGFFAFLFGILPDIDILVLSMTGTPAFQHHTVFSHGILFWVLMWILLWVFVQFLKRTLNNRTRKVLNDRFLSILHKSFLIAVISHLFADMLFGFTRILYPLEIQVTLLGQTFTPSYFSGYLYSPAAVLELLIIIVFVYMVYRNFFTQTSIVKYTLFSLFTASIILLLFTTYMNLNTYNKSFHTIGNQQVYDADYDGLIDYLDPDTNSSGINNIEDADIQVVAHFAEEIIEGNYFATSRKTLWERVKFRYGAFTSYRLISQSYFNQNKPIEPVLLQFAREKYNIRSYSIDIPYTDLLYEYFNDNNKLVEFNIEENYRGKIFFIIDEDENIQNIGLILGINRAGIVLENDSRLTQHAMERVIEEYPEYTLIVQE
jgi:hypothetical protein